MRVGWGSLVTVRRRRVGEAAAVAIAFADAANRGGWSAAGGELHCNGRRGRGLPRVSVALEGSFGFGTEASWGRSRLRPIDSNVGWLLRLTATAIGGYATCGAWLPARYTQIRHTAVLACTFDLFFSRGIFFIFLSNILRFSLIFFSTGERYSPPLLHFHSEVPWRGHVLTNIQLKNAGGRQGKRIQR